jgi:hypothetical protein
LRKAPRFEVIHQRLALGRGHEFLEGHGLQMQEFDPPHRHGILELAQRKIQQRPCRDDVQFRHQFMEIA